MGADNVMLPWFLSCFLGILFTSVNEVPGLLTVLPHLQVEDVSLPSE